MVDGELRMEYILIIQGIFIIVLLVLYLRGEYLLNKKGDQISLIDSEESWEQRLNGNRRKHYRLGIEDVICSIEIIHFGSLDNQMNNTEFEGYIDNISAGGLKFTTKQDLPVKGNITIEVKFQIKEKNYAIQGKIVRREELLENELYGYGVEFNHSSRSQMINLTNTLLQLEIETLKKAR